jgi:hypothetical protein
MTWHAGPVVNLLPAGRARALASRRRLRLWTAVLCAYGLLVAGAWAWWGLGARLAAATSTAAPAAEQLRALEDSMAKCQADSTKVRAEMTAMRTKLDGARAVGHHADWSILLSMLAEQGSPPRPQIVFERVELQPRKPEAGAAQARDAKDKTKAEPDAPDALGYTLTLEGVAGSQLDVVGYTQLLQQLNLFESVSLVGTRPRDSVAPDAPGLHLVNFQISCVLTDAAAAAHAAPAKGENP